MTYDAESWTFTNKMLSLNKMAKENIEKNIQNNMRKRLLENKNEWKKIHSKLISPDIITVIKVSMIYDHHITLVSWICDYTCMAPTPTFLTSHMLHLYNWYYSPATDCNRFWHGITPTAHNHGIFYTTHTQSYKNKP